LGRGRGVAGRAKEGNMSKGVDVTVPVTFDENAGEGLDPVAAEVLSFWFGDMGPDYMKMWFAKDPVFDATIKQKYAAMIESAADGKERKLAAWETHPLNALAAIVVLDQFPRNAFRGEFDSFAYCGAALLVAQKSVFRKFDQDPEVHFMQRHFFYLPFMHHELLSVQDKSVELYEKYVAEAPAEHKDWAENTLKYAIAHRDIVARFGRFPHRNEVLGRESTPEEIEFLKTPGSSF